MREVTAQDIPGLKLALEHCTKYEDRMWFSFLIKMHERQVEQNRPRLRLTGVPKRAWNNGYDYTAVYSERGREYSIRFHIGRDQWPTDDQIRTNVGHELFLAGWPEAHPERAEIIRSSGLK